MAQLRDALLGSVMPLASLKGKAAGGGLVNARGALDRIGGTTTPSPTTTTTTTTRPPTTTTTTTTTLPPPPQGNLLVNPGFENGVTGWSCSGYGAIDPAAPHGGARSLRLDSNFMTTSVCRQTVTLTPGRT